MSSQEPAPVAAAIITDGDRVLLAQRSQLSPLPGVWEFPGGKVEPHETAEECLVRELQEELGIHIRVLRPFAESTYTYAHGAFKVYAFLVTWISGKIDARIHENIAWVRIDQLLNYNLLAADVSIAAALASMASDKEGATIDAAAD